MRVISAIMLAMLCGFLIGKGMENYGIIVGGIAWMFVFPELTGQRT